MNTSAAPPTRLVVFALTLCLLSLLFFGAAVVVRFHDIGRINEENRARIDENAKTAQALCDAAAGARDFWIGVRATTLELLRDPELSPIERRSNERYVRRLTSVIAAADGVAHTCDHKE